MAQDKIEVQLATQERYYVRVYKDFLATKQLTTEEKMAYIALKSFVDFKHDEGQVYPSMDTICQLTSMSRPRATRVIKSLEKKGVVEKERRGLTKSNLYTLHDNPQMWAAGSVEEMHDAAEYKIPFTTQELIEELKRRGIYSETKKEPTSDTDQSTDVSTSSLNVVKTTNNIALNDSSCQERYTLDQLRAKYSYDAIITDRRCNKKDLDAVMDILYDTLNSTKPTIRVAGEDKPTMVVIGKLMGLTHEEIIYAIKKYNEVTDRIGNPKSYMLKILYTAREQMTLDINNQVQHNMYGQTDDTD